MTLKDHQNNVLSLQAVTNNFKHHHTSVRWLQWLSELIFWGKAKIKNRFHSFQKHFLKEFRLVSSKLTRFSSALSILFYRLDHMLSLFFFLLPRKKMECNWCGFLCLKYIEYRRQYVIIVLIERRCTGCTNK